MIRTWMIRAGRGGRYFEAFREGNFVAIGWSALGPLNAGTTREEMIANVRAMWPDLSVGSAAVAAGQLLRFVSEIATGDRVVTYDPRARSYLCGTITGEYRFETSDIEDGLTNKRDVKWDHETSRDDVSQAARFSLGALTTIFAVSPAVSDELWKAPSDTKLELTAPEIIEIEQGEEPEVASFDFSPARVQEIASEKIKDRIARLSWQDLQELVAGLLRAMGYKTIVSPPGSDRGKDIIASPDGFGFQEPRIVVEVKHRPRDRMGAPEVRSFIGGRKAHEKGLYVSTGGFTREAYYEAERSQIPLTLLDFEELVEAVLTNYANFDARTRQIVPLTQVYWPL